MSNSTTATVETLTAEVRVLMVGSRQVTLSVARQLDGTAPSLINPFGRVRIIAEPQRYDLEVIGSHQMDGSLCRSHIFVRARSCAGYGAGSEGAIVSYQDGWPVTRKYCADSSGHEPHGWDQYLYDEYTEAPGDSSTRRASTLTGRHFP